MNKAVLMRKVSKATGLTLRETSACIDAMIDAITSEVSRNGRVEFRGLGTFLVKKTAARKIVFNNSASTIVPEHGRVVFRPCQKLRQSVWNQKSNSVALRVEQLN